MYTVQNRSDGFGAQFQTIICGIIITETNSNKYIHTPIKSMEHNYNNNIFFIDDIENLMNIKSNFECINDENKDQINIMNIHDIINIFDTNINVYSICESLKKLKNIFRSNKKFFDENKKFNNNKLNIAVHIRRQLNSDIDIGPRYTDDNYFLEIMNKLRIKYKNKEILFHIYSEADCIKTKLESFDIYKCDDVVLHINEDLSKTFIEMVGADILVMSNSSFSYSAAILSDGEIYCMSSFWHEPFNNWILTDN